MPLDPASIITLVGVLVTFVAQSFQMLFDYKKAKADKQHDEIYHKTFKSSCCGLDIQSEEDHQPSN